MITPRRFARALTAPLLVAALASCTSTSPAASPAAIASPSPSPSATVSAAEAGEQLTHHRLAGPADASYSAANGVIDLDSTVDALLGQGAGADAKAELKGRLTQRGFVVALRHAWSAPDGTGADTLLMRFSADAGAEAFAGSWAQGLKSAHPDTVFTDPSNQATSVVVNTPDGEGKTSVSLVAPHGDAVVVMNYLTPAAPDPRAAGLRFTNQLGLLPTPGLPW